MRDIIWQGDPLVKEIQHWKLSPMRAEVTTLVVLRDGQDSQGQPRQLMGLVLQGRPLELLPARNKEEATEHDSLAPFEIDETGVMLDPVRWWRAAQLLAVLPQIDHRCDFDLFIAAGRPAPDADFDQRLVGEVRAALPPGVYEEIMARPVPLSILEWIVKHSDAGLDLHQALWQITKEIDAGTVRWSQTLKRIGVEHPEYRRAVKDAARQLTLRYGLSLCSYATFQEHPYDLHNHRQKAWIMLCVENALYGCIERGIERDYGQAITILVAVLVAEIESDQTMERLAAENLDSDYYQYQLRFHVPREERFAQMQRWCSTQGRGTPNIGVWEDTLPLLRRLCDAWDHLPIVCPLVD
jgi:hypothetical protein